MPSGECLATLRMLGLARQLSETLEIHSLMPGLSILEVKAKYLRIEFTTSGSFTSATNLMTEKASKALFMLKQSNLQNNIKVGFKFFLSLIMPIMSNCCEIWSPFLLKNSNVQKFLTTVENLIWKFYTITFVNFKGSPEQPNSGCKG